MTASSDRQPGEQTLVTEDAQLGAICEEAARRALVAVDVEADGMHAYRARICIVQLAWNEGRTLAVVDALTTPLGALAAVLGPEGPVKIVHDVAFDARLFGQDHLPLARVHDTAVAAQMLGRKSTGLASLLESELGVRIPKTMQHHDWRTRPLDAAMLSYLAEDVAHLEALHARIWSEVDAKGIEAAVLAETDYRIACADPAHEATPVRPAYMRMKGADRLSEAELAVLRAVYAVRDRWAHARDVPPYRVAPHEALLEVARARPKTASQVARLRGMPSSPQARPLLEEVAAAAAGAGDRLPDDERALLHPDRPAAGVLRARKEREARLVVWRREQAALRSVDEQVVLPGHCLRDAAALETIDVGGLSRVPGIGPFRIQRDGESILRVLRGVEPRGT